MANTIQLLKGRTRSATSLLAVILLALLVSVSAPAFAQSFGTLNGTVKTADGKPVESATVAIASLARTVSTNEAGEFRLTRIPAGNYVLSVRFMSFQTQEQNVTVLAGKTLAVSFSLTESSQRLQEVSIATEKTNKFSTKRSDYVARMPLENLENVQVYSSIGKDLITEQLVVDFKESLRNAPGVSPNNNPAGGTGATMRGFTATTTVRNGLAVQSYQSDPILLERVEVIKGPSATLFGSSISTFGGLINQVTKKPLDTLGGELTLGLGNNELSRITADINTPLNTAKTALLRINAAAHRENSFQNFGHKRMYTFAPGFSYQVSDRLTFLLQAELNSTDRSTVAYYQNLSRTSYTNFNQIPVPFKTALTGSNLGASLTSNNFFAEARYKLSDSWTSTSTIAYGENQIEHSHQVYPQWTADNKFDRTISSYGPRIFTSLNGQQNFNGDFNIGGLRNRFLGGINFYTFRSFLRFSSTGLYDQIDLGTSKLVPGINLEKVEAIIATKTQTNTENKQGSYSAYASDVLNVTDQFMAMLSLRVDRFENARPISNGVQAATGAYNQTAWSPKLGLIYQLVRNQVSLFGNYTNGFQNVAPVTQPSGAVDVFKPRQANQLEGGVKLEVFNKKLNATFSYYDIRISNDTRVVNLITVQDGTSRSKGFEAELIANPVSGLNIIGGYATNSYKVTRASANVGNYQAQTPTRFANLWMSYKFTGEALKNIGLGLGGNYVADCFFDAENKITIPGYTVVNASLFYDQPKWRLGLKMNNLANKEYWTNWSIPETTRQFIANLSFKF